MGHKFYLIQLRSKPARTLPFGTRVWSEGSTITIHTARVRMYCDYCNNRISKGEPYLRLRILRGEFANQGTDRRCMTCVRKGVLPERIEKLEIAEKG